MLKCKVYYSLLALSYLEVVLWSSCLVVSLLSTTSVESTDSQQYLRRETVNLECLAGRTQPATSVTHQLFARVRLLLKVVLQVFRAWTLFNHLRSTSLIQNLFAPVGGPLLCNLEAQQGLPAPYIGVKAII